MGESGRGKSECGETEFKQGQLKRQDDCGKVRKGSGKE